MTVQYPKRRTTMKYSYPHSSYLHKRNKPTKPIKYIKKTKVYKLTQTFTGGYVCRLLVMAGVTWSHGHGQAQYWVTVVVVVTLVWPGAHKSC